MKVVLDTNVLIMSISKGSPFHSVWTEFLSGRYTILDIDNFVKMLQKERKAPSNSPRGEGKKEMK